MMTDSLEDSVPLSKKPKYYQCEEEDTPVKPTIPDLQYVADSVAVSQSDGICRRLGVSEAVLSQAQQTYPLNTAGAPVKRFMYGLQDWYNRNGVLDGRAVPVTYSVLCKALEDSSCRGVAEELRKRNQGRHLAIRGLIEKVLTNLKEVYQSPVIADHWLLKDAKMDFVKLQLIKLELKVTEAELLCAPSVASATGQSHDIKEEPFGLQDILEYEPVRPQRKRILLEGEPGIGKSTLTKQLCYKFAEGTFASEYKLVIRLVLRGLPSNTTLNVEDLVRSCTSDVNTSLDEKDVFTLSQYITAHKGKDTLFIMDGYDEFPEELQKESLVADIINGKTLPQSSFIITSRPRASALLHDKIDRRIEVSGFGKKEIQQFIGEYYGESSSSAATLIERLNSTMPRIKAMCFVPLILLMTCYVNYVRGALPDTISALFQYIVCLTVKRHFEEKKGEEMEIDSLEDVLRLCPFMSRPAYKYPINTKHHSFSPHLIKLSKVALYGVLNNVIIFDQKLKLSEDDHLDLSKVEHFGLINCISYRSAFGGVTRSYHFLHRTVQEFLAACAVKQLPAEEQSKFWKEKLVLGYNKRGDFILSDSNYEMPFLFFCGIGGLENDAVRDLLFEPLKFTNDHRFIRGTPFPEIATAVAESRNEELCQKVMEYCENEVVICFGSLGYLSLNSLVYLTTTCSKHIKRLSVTDPADSFIQQISEKVTYLEEVEITSFSEIIRKEFLESQSSLAKLTFNVVSEHFLMPDTVSIHSERLEHLGIHLGITSPLAPLVKEPSELMSSVATCQQLKSLSLAGVSFIHEDIKVLLDNLPHLVTMEMVQCKYEGGDIDVNCIRRHPSLEDVTLARCDVNLMKVFLFAIGIKDKRIMKKVNVDFSECSYKDYVELLACVVSCMKSSLKTLKTLCLRRMEGVPQCCEVFECLRSSKIEEFLFELKHSTALPEDLTDLVECGVGQCRTLRKVTMGAGGHQTLTSSILKGMIQNPSLEQVELWGCDFKRNEALLLELLQRQELKSVRLGKIFETLQESYINTCYNIIPRDIANVIVCLRDNTSLKELTIRIRTETKQSENIQDVTEEDVLTSVEQAVKENTILERLEVDGMYSIMNWRNVAERILKGAAANQNLRQLELLINEKYKKDKEYLPKQEVVDDVRKVNQKLRLIVNIGEDYL